MRLGGPVFLEENSPDAWIAALQQAGYRAAVFPNLQAGIHYTPADYAAAAHRADSDTIAAAFDGFDLVVEPFDEAIGDAVGEVIDNQTGLR
jgi:hypothetical protein